MTKKSVCVQTIVLFRYHGRDHVNRMAGLLINWRSLDFLSLFLEVPVLIAETVVLGLNWDIVCTERPLREWLLVSCCLLAVIIAYTVYMLCAFAVPYPGPLTYQERFFLCSFFLGSTQFLTIL